MLYSTIHESAASHLVNRKKLQNAVENIFKAANRRDKEVFHKRKDYFRQGYLPYGDKKVYKTDYLICSDQKNLD